MKLIYTLLLATSLSASTINLCSDLTSEGNDHGANVAITPHPVWAESPCQWISFANTGDDGEVIPNGTVTSFWEAFALPGPATGSLTVWADDTARVRLVNAVHDAVLVEAAFVLDAHCAAGAIGCQPGEGLLIVLDGYLAAGLNTLHFDVWQLGGGPSGAMWAGSVQTIPEPSALLMMTMVALTLGCRRKR